MFSYADLKTFLMFLFFPPEKIGHWERQFPVAVKMTPAKASKRTKLECLQNLCWKEMEMEMMMYWRFQGKKMK